MCLESPPSDSASQGHPSVRMDRSSRFGAGPYGKFKDDSGKIDIQQVIKMIRKSNSIFFLEKFSKMIFECFLNVF